MNLLEFLQAPLPFLVLSTLLGAIAGSFLSMLVYRLPLIMRQQWHAECCQLLSTPEEKADNTLSLSLPRSFCPHCRHPLRLIDNIPITGYLLNGGKCHFCASPIGWRYISVELLGIAIAVIAALHWGPSLHALAAMLFGWILIALLFIDLEHQLLPDPLTLSLLWSGLLLNQSTALFTSPSNALWGTVAGYLILWLIYHLHKLLTGREGMGHGDFKLLAALGAWCGATLLPQIILLASLSALAIALPLLLIQRIRSKSRDNTSVTTTAIPFGPYLALGGWLSLLYGEVINSLLIPGLTG
ncbi:MAG: prepilin peptidase [Gammaproteobacteria bacterium]|nr:prepilin peptidase [Gammaproteobacteria bacterium]MBT3488683.1 prepilin peptidase [Gammaproteobacteria bacterium]MBT3717435.1 prepilin peptidase [Gammaproteobacteria bacterium]MBT3844214.1 prepilin peptidase [Gammaproteobacteria bacterium]MBT3892085.1 prepilin peptidase [Gammaproteobacteria bacterium]